MKPRVIRPLIVASLLLVASLAIYGCGGEPAAPASPRDAYIQFTEALMQGKEARLLAAVEANE